ncbi:MAG TPA: chorismate synthase [Gemmatimonadales bacterium]|nr:chorismate synthase [Gemmatimonadales bacterium]
MTAIRFTTAGESHGRAVLAVLEGVPAGLPLLAADVDADLARRMKGYGRGARMKIEADRVQLLSGVRAGATLGSPITLLVENRDFEHWRDVMAPEPAAEPPRRQLTRPRPGHADLAGSLKYDRADARDILERASARETAARVAAGAVCRRLLAELGVEIGSHVVALGGVLASPPSPLPVPLDPAADRSPVRCLDPEAERAMVAQIDAAAAAGDTLGGVVEVVARGLVVGLGSHVAWDRRLDGRLAAALMSIPAVKGVEVGLGFALGGLPGSQAHDEIVRADAAGAASGGFARTTNRAGGLEGGMTTGEPLVLRAAMKPISTLMTPLRSVDLRSGRPAPAQSERSDVTAVPALGVIAEAAVALTLADAVAEKFGGDSLDELRRNRDGYLAQLERRRAGWEPVD